MTYRNPTTEGTEEKSSNEADFEPDWEHECICCSAVPTLPATGLCGPCTFGEADTVGGNW